MKQFLKEKKRYARLVDLQRYMNWSYQRLQYNMKVMIKVYKTVEKEERGIYVAK
jgi:hypothetical protein